MRADSSLENVRILLIEDDPDDVFLTRELLRDAEEAFFALDHTTDPVEGLDRLLRNDCDVCLLDYRLGSVDGIEILQRAIEGGCVKPIILLTGQNDSDLAREALRTGASDYLVKGQIDTPALERSIRHSVERKRLELQLRRFNVELEKRVEDRTRELTAANAEMEGFTYSVSHDLRTPLRAIVSTSRILMEDFAKDLPRPATALLERQAKAAARMAVLIDDLLQLSRLSKIDFARKPVDLTALFLDVVREKVEGLDPASAEIAVQSDMTALGDEVLLRSVAGNLIENALKFAKPGEPARIRVGSENGAFFVRDEGIGFEQKYESKMWQPFQRLVLDDDYPGTGIGLANVRRIVERHGGEVWAESRPGEGSTFWFTLPP